MKSWVEVLKNKKFERKDQKMVKRFLSKPFNQGFLPIVEVLKKYDFLDEAFELLNYGVGKYPRYTAARILFAKELYEKGLIQDAWDKVKTAKTPIHENILAQRILFKVAILNEHENTAKSVLQHMTHRRLLDRELELLGKKLNLGGIKVAKASLVEYFKNKGISIALAVSSRRAEGEKQGNILGSNSQAFNFNHKVISDPSLKHYHVVPLSQIFHAKDEPDNYKKSNDTKNLESQTLAEIYQRQGHFEKSLEIYRRLLKISPGNDYLKRMVIEIAKKSDAQQRQDLMIDPELVETENEPKTKANVKFYKHLLDKLGHESSP
ncbi:MAG: tetratricopeptide repeat protein [Oligoflexales bacterium]